MRLATNLNNFVEKQADLKDYLEKGLLGALLGAGGGGTLGGIYGTHLAKLMDQAKIRSSDMIDELSDLQTDAQTGLDNLRAIEESRRTGGRIGGTTFEEDQLADQLKQQIENVSDQRAIAREQAKSLEKFKDTPSRLPYFGLGAGALLGGLGGVGYQGIKDLLTKE